MSQPGRAAPGRAAPGRAAPGRAAPGRAAPGAGAPPGASVAPQPKPVQAEPLGSSGQNNAGRAPAGRGRGQGGHGHQAPGGKMRISKAGEVAQRFNCQKLSPVKLDELWQIFCVFDADKSGAINESELSAALNATGLIMTHQEVHDIIHAVDLDGCGELDFDEFCAIFAAQSDDDVVRAQAQGVFKLFDVDQDGQLSPGDLLKSLQNANLGTGFTLEHVTAALSSEAIDSDHSLKLDLEEFIRLCIIPDVQKDASGRDIVAEIKTKTALERLSMEQRQELAQLFQNFDKDHSGVISFNELTEILVNLGMTQKEVNDMLKTRKEDSARIIAERKQRAANRAAAGEKGPDAHSHSLNPNGIDQDEFMEMMAPMYDDSDIQDACYDVFRMLDVDEDDSLSANDLKISIPKFFNNLSFTDAELTGLTTHSHGGGHQHSGLSFEEFVSALADGAQILKNRRNGPAVVTGIPVNKQQPAAPAAGPTTPSSVPATVIATPIKPASTDA